jgi:hypothetical protein
VLPSTGPEGGTFSTGALWPFMPLLVRVVADEQGKGKNHTLSLRVPVRVPRQTGLFIFMRDDEIIKGLVYGVTLAASIWLLAFLLSVL